MNAVMILAFILWLVVFSSAGTLPRNWRDFIDPDILDEPDEDQSRYSSDKWEGDISSLEPGERPPNVAANAVDDVDLMWPNNTIPYVFNTEKSVRFRRLERTRIGEAMEIMMHLTGKCVDFVERTAETDYIKFQKGFQSFSDIGRTGGKQIVSLSSGCIKHYGCIQHELMHVLGFFHEQSRSDRDEYVIINWDNIDKEEWNQFTKHSGQTYGLPYDYESVMHYEVRAFAVDNQLPTIIPNVKKAKLGQKENLSSLDVARIYRRFKCSVASGQNFVKPQTLIDNPTDALRSNSVAEENSPKKDLDARENARTEPFPIFSGEPMSQEQCAYQFNANCAHSGYTTKNCTFTQALQIDCDIHTTAAQLQDMATGMFKGPKRAISVSLHGGQQLDFDSLAVVRKLIVSLSVFNCLSNRTTGKLPQLQYSNLLEFDLQNCYAMWIRRSDFAELIKLKVIQFWNTTIRDLEKETFTDLPSLRYLTLENGFYELSIFSEQIRRYLKRLHCGCEFSWFRKWWDDNQQLVWKNLPGEVYSIRHSFSSFPSTKNDTFLPIDCSSLPFPSGAASIDFKQERFSINDNNDLCMNTTSESTKSFPDFREEPLTSEQCAIQFSANCMPLERTRSNCTNVKRLEISCNSMVTLEEIKLMASSMAKIYPRPTRVNLYDGMPISFANLGPIHEQIFIFSLWNCQGSRGTNKPDELRLFNLLHFAIGNCYDLNVVKSDFQRTLKLRIVQLINSTVLALERDTFSDLPSLRILALENGLSNLSVFSAKIRDYLIRLHCSCEFAWYRRWWSRNTVLDRQAEAGVIYTIRDAWANDAYAKEDIYLPVDCLEPPSRSADVDADQVEFSVNDKKCTS